jgi:Na+-transporting NADH:ubiquinone oxidoreductase subunit NqrB
VLYTGAISQTDKFFNKMNVFTVERIQKWTNLLGLLILTACLSWGLREVTMENDLDARVAAMATWDSVLCGLALGLLFRHALNLKTIKAEMECACWVGMVYFNYKIKATGYESA